MNYKNIIIGIIIFLLVIAGISFWAKSKTEITPQPFIAPPVVHKKIENKPNMEAPVKTEREGVPVKTEEEKANILNTAEDLEKYEEEQAKQEVIQAKEEVERSASIESDLEKLKAELEAAKTAAATPPKTTKRRVRKTVPAKIDEEGNVVEPEKVVEEAVEEAVEAAPVADIGALEDQIRLKVDELEYPPLVNP